MKRLFRFLFALAWLMTLSGAPFASAQNAAEIRTNPATSDGIGAKLIAWSEFQKPRPVVCRNQPVEPDQTLQQAREAAATNGKQQEQPTQGDTDPWEVHSSSTNKVESVGR